MRKLYFSNSPLTLFFETQFIRVKSVLSVARKLLLIAALLVACNGLHATTYTINVSNIVFTPSVQTIYLGDTLHFVWVNGFHIVSPDTSGDWTNFTMDATHLTHDVILTSAGDYPYYCTIHGGPNGSGMSGVIHVAPLPYLSESFETAFTGSPAAPPGWTQTRLNLLGAYTTTGNAVDGPKDWARNTYSGGAWSLSTRVSTNAPVGAELGSNALYIQDSYFGNTTNVIGQRRVESPIINLSASTSPYVRFYYTYGTVASTATTDLRVVASSDGGTTWKVIMQVASGATNGWQRINVPIPSAYRTANCKIGFEMSSAYGNADIFIDNLTVENFTPTTITSTATGNWGSTTTWVGGVVPTADNNVVIAATHTVTVNVNLARCQNLTVSGTLTHDATTTHLTQIFGNLTVNSGGTYKSFNAASGRVTYLGGNLVNNGTINFSIGQATLAWFGGAPATYSGTGSITTFISNIWHANTGGVTYNNAVQVRNTVSLIDGDVNPNGNLTVGNSAVTTQTIERESGKFTAAPIWGSGVTRSVSYLQSNTTLTSYGPQTITSGEEIESVSGTRTVGGTLLMNTYGNVQLTYPLTIGTGAAGTLTLTRGIIINNTTNVLTINNTTSTGTAGTAPSTAAIPLTHGSYVTGSVRINFPSSGSTTRTFPLGVGSDFNSVGDGALPTANVKKELALATTTAWASQTLTASIESAPTGTVNSPITTLFGNISYRLNRNGGSDLSTTATVQIRGNNYTYGSGVNSDNMNTGDQSELRVVQASATSGAWSERSATSGAGAFVSNTFYSRTTATSAPGPVGPLATNGEYFALATTHSACVPVSITTCPETQTQNLNGSCQISLADYTSMVVAAGTCGSFTFTQSPVAGTTISGVGTTSVTVTVTDGSNNTATCTFNVDRVDNTAPTITTCPGTQTQNLNGSCQITLADFTSSVIASDNCSAVTKTQSPTAGTVISGVGTTSVTVTVTDASSNSATCTFNVSRVDNTAPTITTCPGTQTQNLNGSCQITLADYTSSVIVSDNCSAVTKTQSPTAGTVISGVGTTSVTVTVTDASSNSATCTFNVSRVDNTAPTITTCPGTQTQNLNGSCQITLADYTSSVIASDNCSAVTKTQSPAAGTVISGVGTTSVTVTVTDASSNSATCTFNVSRVDNTAPTISTCPGTQTQNLNGSCQITLADYTSSVIASDNCSAVTKTQSPTVGTVISGVGTTSVTVTVTDASSNSATCTFNVSRVDNTAPSITTCPGTQTQNLNGSCQITLADYTSSVIASDNCSAVTKTQSPAAGTVISGVGTTSVTVTATDVSNNSATCTFNVDRVDNTAPSITTCPGTQTQNLNGSCQITLADYTSSVIASDNCSAVTKTQSPTVGTVISGVGTTSVTVTVTDASSNSATCTFNVSRVDNTAPSITTCPGTQTQNLNGSCQITLADYTSSVIASDNCSAVTKTQSPAAGTVISGVGTTSVTVTATDVSNNSATCTFNVDRVDNTAPSITTCPGTQTQNLNGSCQITLADYTSSVIASDNCSAVTKTQSPTAGTVISGVGTTSVTVTATDVSNNSATCTFNVDRVDNTAPSITTCPGTQTQNLNGSCQITLADYTSSVIASDNCSAVTKTQSPVAGTVISGVGTTSVTVTVTDASNNSTTCTFNVSRVDNTAPSITTCPGTQTQNLNGSCQITLADYTSSVIASDNCSAVTKTQSPVAGTVISGVGTTSVTVTVTDASNNSATCTFNVSRVDNTAPTITTCPGTQTQNLNGSCQITLADYTSMVVGSDNCSAVTKTQSPVAGTVISGVGTTSVTVTVTDASNNSATCTFNVSRVDNTVPTITTCPGTQTQNLNGSCQITLADYTSMVVGSDNCSAVTKTQSPVAGTVISGVGTTSVTVTVTDASNNSATCTFNVSRVDNTVPTITTCPGAQSQNLDGSCQITLADYTSLVVASDNCSSVTKTQSPLAGTVISGVGTTSVTITVMDASGNPASTSCTFNVNRVDNTTPVISGCPSNITTNNPTVSWTPPTATDNCSAVTLTSNYNPGDTFPIGTTTVTYTATDASGNSSTCSFTVTYNPAAVNDLPCNAFALAFGTNGSYDTQLSTADVGEVAPPALGCSVIGGWCNSTVSNSLWFTFVAPTSGHVSVQTPDFDTQLAVWTTSNCSNYGTYTLVTAIDNDPSYIAHGGVQFSSWVEMNCLTVGQTYYVQLDPFASPGSTTTVVLTDLGNLPPVAFTGCPSNISVNNTAGLCGANVSWTAPTAGPDPEGCTVSVTSNHNPGDFFSEGTTAVTYTANDGHGGTATCTFNVTVNDNEAPVITTCPATQTQNLNGSCQITLADYTSMVVASDNCSGVTKTQSPIAGTTISGVGTTSVTVTVTDASNNSSTCTFNVSRVDNTAPTITTCPGTQTQNLNGSCQITLADYTSSVVGSDNCSAVTKTQSPVAGTVISGVGTTSVTVNVTDASNNSATCTFNVSRVDNTAPSITTCPGTQTQNLNGSCQISLTDYTSLVIASDNCSAVTKTQSPAAGTIISGVGTTSVTVTATDASNNSTTCTFNVDRVDNTAPSITTCPGTQTQNLNGSCQITLADYTSSVIASDNCSAVTKTQSPVAGTVISGVGTTSVTVTVTDVSNNSTTCTFNVNRVDNTAPTITTCPGTQTQNLDGSCQITLADYTSMVVASDNCSGVTETQSPAAGTVISGVGTTSVTVTVSDASNNSSTCTFNVSRVDNIAPSITSCPGTQTQNLNGSCQITLADYTSLVIASDNCSAVTKTQSPAAGTVISGVGTSSVTITVADASGNPASTSCTFNVDMVDNTAPVISGCPSNITTNNPVVFWTPPTATDNCSAVTMISNYNPGDTFPIGSTTVTYTATDAGGNSSTCNFIVTYNPNSGAPANDYCVNAINTLLSSYGLFNTIVNCNALTGTNANSTLEAGEPTPTCAAGGNYAPLNSVWYKFMAPTCGGPFTIRVSSNNAGTDFNTVVSAYQSSTNDCNFANFSLLGCNDDSGVSGCNGPGNPSTSTVDVTSYTPGEPVFIQVDGLAGSTGNVAMSISVEPSAPTLTPGGLPTTQINATWNGVNPNHYDLYYRQAGGPGYAVILGLTNPAYTLQNLMPATSYEVQVKNVCIPNGVEKYLSPVSSLTTAVSACSSPGTPTCITITNTSITIGWTNVPAAIQYKVFWRQTGMNGYGVVNNVQSTTHTFNNLQPGTDYEFWVRAVCSSNNPNENVTGPHGICTTLGNPKLAKDESKITDYDYSLNGVTYHNWDPADLNIDDLYLSMNTASVDISNGQLQVHNANGDEMTDNLSFNIYPNPANSTATITGDLPTDGMAVIKVYDVQGKLLKSINVNAEGHTLTYTLSLDDMPSGLYNIVIETGTDVQTQKLAVIK